MIDDQENTEPQGQAEAAAESTADNAARQRIQTTKGLEYATEQSVKDFKLKKAHFAKQNRKILQVRGHTKDPTALQAELDQTELSLEEAIEAFNIVTELSEDALDNSEVAKLKEQFATLKQDTQGTIEYLQNENIEQGSVASRRSGASRRSHKSNMSAASSKSRISDAAARAAALQAELAFLDIENEKEREMKKVRMQKEIAIAQAEVEARTQVERNIQPENMRHGQQPLNDINSTVQTQAEIITTSTHASVSSGVPIVVSDQSVISKSAIQTPSTFIATSSIPAKYVGPQMSYTYSAGLNPQASVFTPVSSQRHTFLDSKCYTTASSQSMLGATFPIGAPYTPPIVSTNQGIASPNVVNLINAMRLPPPEPPVFSGNVMEFPRWQAAFNTLIDQSGSTADMKIQYLLKYLSGQPKEMVTGYQYCPSEQAYQEARKKLSHRYGDSMHVARAFKDKLASWPTIQARDGAALRAYGDFLVQCSQAMLSVRGLQDLASEQENQKLVHKLPAHCVNKWGDILITHMEKHGSGSFPSFGRLVEFVQRQAEVACHPVVASMQRRSDTKPQQQTRQQRTTRNSGARVFSTHGRQSVNKVKDDEGYTCLLCKTKAHHIDECEKFMALARKDKVKFMHENRVCYGCGTSTSHMYRRCQEKRMCRICSRTHLTCFHRDKQRIEEPQTQPDVGFSRCTTVCSLAGQNGGKDHSMIVPVWVRNANTKDEHLCYAIIDDQSNVSFVTDAMKGLLGLDSVSTNLTLSTMHKKSRVPCEKVFNLEVDSYDRSATVQVSRLYTRSEIPASRSQIPKVDVAMKWEHLRPLADQLMPYDPELPIALLIGNDCPMVTRPRDIVAGGDMDPYGQKSVLGWGIIGRVCKTPDTDDKGYAYKVQAYDADTIPSRFVHSIHVKESITPDKVICVLESDFIEHTVHTKPYSAEDTKFIELMENSIQQCDDGHYEMPLPLKTQDIQLPHNRVLAEKRLRQLSGRFARNEKFKADYIEFMRDVVQNCAEKVPPSELTLKDGTVNYIPHTGVYHPKKPDKIRVVFDCSASYGGVSLNDYLLQGPDLTNNLVGVLCRFRQEHVAVMADIKAMFHQFRVIEPHRNFLRFLWWDNESLKGAPVEYRMKVHLFGAVSSPGCANFALKRAAADGEQEFGKKAADYIRNNFYVDDGLKSVPDTDEAISLVKNAKGICARAGLQLHKFMSNDRGVLESVEPDERGKGAKEINLEVDKLPIERALGVIWCVENDSFQFRIELKARPYTRRGILSTVSAVYDPLGFAGPVVLSGKHLLQELCKSNAGWDEPLPAHLVPKWENWLEEIIQLDKLNVKRCFKPPDFGQVTRAELHHFSDASQVGYGQCSYIRLVDEKGKVNCSFVIGKARVAPLKHVTIPKLELTAALVSARMSEVLRRELELDIPVDQEFFYTDSQIVLGYIRNSAKRFHVYVANRVQQIHDATDVDRWFHVDTHFNPADDASRGLSSKQLPDSLWLKGPDFLWQRELPDMTQPVSLLEESDPEVRLATCHSVNAKGGFPPYLEPERLTRCTDLNLAQKAVAHCLRLKALMRARKVKKPLLPVPLDYEKVPKINVSQMLDAERVIIQCAQRFHFREEFDVLSRIGEEDNDCPRDSVRRKKSVVRKASALSALDPFVDTKGILRVGGRLNRANIAFELKHPAIIPKDSFVAQQLINRVHTQVNHMGRHCTHNEMRQRGYWIVNGSSAVAHFISKCVRCKRLRGEPQKQKMADLPNDRLDPAPPFTYCATDYFGPFIVKEGRKELKRYGVVFVCMASRAIHIETANSLETNAFINALRRFICRRGPVRQIRSDQGTNFVGANNELKKALLEMDQKKVHSRLQRDNCEWVTFKMNVPHASHMGGIWERQIRTIRSALEVLLQSAGSQLDDECLRTFMTEAEYIVNSKPLTPLQLSSPDAPEPLTANHLLTMKSKIVLPPPGEFQKEDMYCRRRWRRVQHLANEFWQRWRKEYLQTLQTRPKWPSPKDNLRIGDIVLVKDESLQRSCWQMAKVVETFPSEDALVRKVKILVADQNISANHKRTYLDRPVHKLVLLLRDMV